jgi:LmbE family N-acetylglucosaminyl deacetylase
MARYSPDQDLTLLSVLAHPDDESFGMGGTLALYARRGVSVHLVCATRGEVGDVEPHHLQGYTSIADLREDELRCAAKHLGLAGVHFLGYRDSGMPGSQDNQHPQACAAAPVDEVAARIVHFIRMLQPQVIITFDPIGGYRHPDHIAVHKATVQAFHMAGDPLACPGEYPPYQPEKLYFQTFPCSVMKWAVRLMPLFGKDPRRFGANQDIDLLSLADVHFPIHARINYREVQAEKEAASACHASQGSMGPSSGPLGLVMRFASREDLFMRAYPPAEPGLRERDLFAGVNGRS